MKPEQLSDALNHLPDDLLQEAEQSRQRRHRRPGWQRWGALAACLALAALAGSRLLPWQTTPRPGDSPRPGSSGPSQPQPGGQLPLLTIGGESTNSRAFRATGPWL